MAKNLLLTQGTSTVIRPQDSTTVHCTLYSVQSMQTIIFFIYLIIKNETKTRNPRVWFVTKIYQTNMEENCWSIHQQSCALYAIPAGNI